MSENRQGIVIRPPSEAGSFLLQVTYGCSHNKCSFCLTYKFTRFAVRPFDKVKEDIELAARWNSSIRRVFLCDGDSMVLEPAELARILDCLADNFPGLERVGVYANASDILSKSPRDLEMLREKKLGIAYLGLESGNDEILERMRKGSTSEEMVRAVQKAQDAGIDMSVIALLGLGSRSLSLRHALDTAAAVSRMKPSYLSALTLMLLPGSPLYKDYTSGDFEIMDSRSVLEELRVLVQNIDTEGTIFRTNHASNYLPLGGVLSRDRDRLLGLIDRGLEDGSLLRDESRRAL